MAESAKRNRQQMDKKQQQQIEEFMASGVDFSPLELDVGDGTIWKFTPDPQPAETQRLSSAMKAISDATNDGMTDAVVESYDNLVSAIRDRLMDEKQKKEFPKPVYGQNALMWFSMRLATGRDGFPTE